MNPPGLSPTPSQPTLGAPTAAQTNNFLPDTANGTKFYTFTASLREEYDDNIYTTRSNKVSSPVTEFSPSLLLSFPTQNTTLSIRFTFGLDYYENGRRGDPNDYTGEILLHYTHQFTDRFSLDIAEQGGYFTEPDLLNSVGTPFRDGSYFENTLTAEYDAQWTPLFGTTTNYSNVAIEYEDDSVGRYQDEDENTLSNDFRFAIFPKFNVTAGFIVDDLEYFQISRGYINTTADVGLDWQLLPSLSLSLRGGGSYTEGDSTPDTLSPYGSASLSWILGKRSNLTADYSHSVQPTDVINAVGQEADRFDVRFSYDVTNRITVHLAGTFTRSDYTQQLLQSGLSFTEDDVALDTGASYRINDNFSVEGGYYLSDISSQEEARDYTRNQVYLGVRGTY
jgi:long-subunit fatty acid transport protein